MTEQRRKTPRVAAQGPCAIRDPDGTEHAFELVDLSECGARLRCEVPIGAMTRIHVAMLLPADRVGQGEDVRLETPGVIVWSHRLEEDIHDIGVFFPELNDEGAALLQAYVLSAV
jgi:hypothetical protein